MRGWKIVSVLLVLLFTASTSFAAGFRLPEAGVKAMGMGFAFTAQADDPSAIYFNPAGLTQLKGQNVMLGVTYVRENGADFTGTTPLTLNTGTGSFDSKSETQKSLNFYIPNMYYTKTTADGYVAYGVGIFSPFGLGQEYNDRNTSIFRDQVTKVDIMTIVVNPTIAFKINEFLSVGAGIDFMYGKAKLNQTGVVRVGATPPLDQLNIFLLDLDGDGMAWGYNFGLLLKPTENLRIGANYRSPFALKIKNGDVNINNINSTVPFVPNPAPPPAALTAAQVFGGTSFATRASTTLNMPATFALGVAYTVGKLTVEADADWTFWSSFHSLDIDFEKNNGLLPDVSRPERWKDVVAIRVGGEYRVTDPLALRLGFVYDPSPVPADTLSPLLPDSNRMNYMVGAGYKIGAWTIDVAGMYIDKKDRTVNNQVNLAPPKTGSGFNGTWTGDAWLAGLDVSYKF
jgi:long-chain fatty acid transport protein